MKFKHTEKRDEMLKKWREQQTQDRLRMDKVIFNRAAKR